MRQQEGTQAMHLRDAVWQRLQAVEAEIQVDQAGQASQAGGQRGQGAREAGTQRIPALPTWEEEGRCSPQSQVPVGPPQGAACREAQTSRPTPPDRDWQLERRVIPAYGR